MVLTKKYINRNKYILCIGFILISLLLTACGSKTELADEDKTTEGSQVKDEGDIIEGSQAKDEDDIIEGSQVEDNNKTDKTNKKVYYYTLRENLLDDYINIYLETFDQEGTKLWSKTWSKNLGEITELGFYSDVVVDNGVMYFSMDNTMYAISISSGDIKWTAESFGYVGPFIVNNDLYHTGFYSNHLYCYDITTGELRWVTEAPDGDYTWAYDISKYGDIIAVSYDFNGKKVIYSKEGEILDELDIIDSSNDSQTYHKWEWVMASSTLNDDTKYHGNNINDFDIETAWVEGVEGYGIQEWISLNNNEYHIINSIHLNNGYQKSYKTFSENGYLKQFLLELGNGEHLIYNCDEINDNHFYNNTIIINLINPVKTDRIKLTILDIYPGSKYEDVCISEIMTR